MPGAPKLTERQARAILAAHEGGARIADLARAHDITYDAVWLLVTGKTWPHLQPTAGAK